MLTSPPGEYSGYEMHSVHKPTPRQSTSHPRVKLKRKTKLPASLPQSAAACPRSAQPAQGAPRPGVGLQETPQSNHVSP
ncbi:unnamed protein product [Arctogadus glacialis]